MGKKKEENPLAMMMMGGGVKDNKSFHPSLKIIKIIAHLEKITSLRLKMIAM